MWIKNYNSLPSLVLFFTDGKRARYIYLNHCIFSKKIKLQSQIEWPVDSKFVRVLLTDCFISLRLSTSVVRCNTVAAAADSSFIFLVEKKNEFVCEHFSKCVFFLFSFFSVRLNMDVWVCAMNALLSWNSLFDCICYCVQWRCAFLYYLLIVQLTQIHSIVGWISFTVCLL